jgi:putative transferase (TIGR04331 family)
LVTRVLVTTADERTWPRDKNQPVLFLGEWCTLYDRMHIWKDLDYEIVPYHWHDKNKFSNDYAYIQNIYDEILNQLANKLNSKQKVNHSLRYWKILIAPWLGYFLQMLFDRWYMLNYALNQYDIKVCHVIDREEYSMTPSDMQHFNSMYMEDDWNEMIYTQLLNEHFSNQVHLHKVNKNINSVSFDDEIKRESMLKKAKGISLKILQVINNLTSTEKDYFFINTYLPIKSDFKLQWILGQIPKKWRTESLPCFLYNVDERKEFKLNMPCMDDFEKLSIKMIPKHIPVAYLEGYRDLIQIAEDVKWPKNPKAIFTSNSYSSDDLFKVWTADKVGKGTPLVIGQHGGMFGMTPFSFEEEQQIDIADKWLSWGWSDSENPKINPVGNFKQLNTQLEHNPQGGALMVTFVTPRYSYHMFSVIVPSQWPEYFNEQCRFVSALPQKLQDEMIVRLFKDDRYWGQKSRWNNRLPNVKLDYAEQPLESMIRRSRIFIATYNSTTYLETLAWNIPTIAFWNPDNWDLRENVKDDFELLKKVKILHDTPESAAEHLANIWNDIPKWWNSEEVQEAVLKFCNQWSYTGQDVLSNIETCLRKDN